MIKKIRRQVLKMLYDAQACHLGSNMSCVEILVTLYFKIMKPRDKFVLSKGHAAAVLYVILAEKGYFSREELGEYYQKEDGVFIGLANKDVPGVEVSTGSLGHGLPIGIGMALADRSRNVYVLMSDGEMDCGTTWESALFAAHHDLSNLTAIIDYNKLQAFGRTNEVLNLEPLDKKWKAFGWTVVKVDGHEINELELALSGPQVKPTIIIADTIKGKGVSFAEDEIGWHYWNMDENQYSRALKENR